MCMCACMLGGRPANMEPGLRASQEFASFSYDSNHEYSLGDSSLKWYYPPPLGTSLSNGLDSFVKHDDSVDEHLDSLLKTIMSHEQTTGEPIDAHVVTWRGMLTKVCISAHGPCR